MGINFLNLGFLGFLFFIFFSFQAFEKNGVEKDVAEHIKKEFDKKHGPTWHCIVGRNFGNLFSLFFFFSPLVFYCGSC